MPQWHGVYSGVVVNNNDPLGVGRLQLNVPQVLGNSVSAWAVPNGSYYTIPANGTTVSVVFLGGDPSQPAWTGPLDLSPIVEAAAPPTVSYQTSAPANPRVGDIWFEIFTDASSNQIIAAPQVWTFNPITSTFSWVVQSTTNPDNGGGTGSTRLGTGIPINAPSITGGTITGGTFINANMVANASGDFFYSTQTNSPVVTPSATGGTVAAGSYYTVIAFVNSTGTSPQSNTSLVATTTGTTSKLTVTAPGATGNATGYNVYMGTSTFGPFYLQNGATPIALNTNYVQTTTPLTSGTTAPTVGTGIVNVASLGNLVASVTFDLSGSDQWGNPYLSGMTSYQLNWSGNPQRAIQSNGGVITYWTAATLGGSWVLGPQITQSGNDLQIATNAGGTAGHVVITTGVGGGASALSLVANPATPTASAGNAVVFANTNGQQLVIDGTDSTTYNTQRRTISLAADSGSISSSTPASVGLSSALGTPASGSRTYRVSGVLFITTTSTPQFGVKLVTPTATGLISVEIKRATTFVGQVSAGPNATAGIAVTLAAGVQYAAHIDGLITVTGGAGTLNLNVFNVTGGTGSYVVNAFSYLDIMPV